MPPTTKRTRRARQPDDECHCRRSTVQWTILGVILLASFGVSLYVGGEWASSSRQEKETVSQGASLCLMV